MKVNIVRLPHALDLPLPAYATEGSAGMDLSAAVDVEIAPGACAMVATGIAIELPPGTEGQVRPRSGLAARHGITVLNAPGTVDSDYRGEVKVLLINHGAAPFAVTRGMRIAQMIVARHEQVELVERDALSDTARGGGGYGSTGLHTVKRT